MTATSGLTRPNPRLAALMHAVEVEEETRWRRIDALCALTAKLETRRPIRFERVG